MKMARDVFQLLSAGDAQLTVNLINFVSVVKGDKTIIVICIIIYLKIYFTGNISIENLRSA